MIHSLRTLLFFKCICLFFLVQMNLSAIENPSTTNNKIVFYYCYFERDDLCKDNLNYFIHNALLDHVDYFFVINGKCSVPLPVKKNLFFFERENLGYDFGGFAYLIEKFDFSNYDYHFFGNTSVRGPFLPSNTSYKNWTEPFLELFNSDVKLVGTTINVLNGDYYEYLNNNYLKLERKTIPTVQTMFFGIDKECFGFLENKKFFDFEKICKTSFEELIAYYEVNLSVLVLQNGWNINCMAPKYRGKDYRKIDADFNPTSCSGDPVFPGAYFGGTLHPYDVIFFKTNRLAIPPDLARTQVLLQNRL